MAVVVDMVKDNLELSQHQEERCQASLYKQVVIFPQSMAVAGS